MNLRGQLRVAVLLAGLAVDVSAADWSAWQSRIGVPAALGEVTDAYGDPHQLPDVILIQDIHQQVEAQGEIAAILVHGRRHWGLKDVFVEGAFGDVPYDTLVAKGGGLSSRALATRGLPGAELAALITDGDIHLIGIDDADLYVRNLQAYRRVQQRQSSALDDLKTLRLLQQGMDLSNSRYQEDELAILERLVRLRLRPADYERYRAAPIETPHANALATTLRNAEDFYQLADARSDAFLARMDAASSPRRRVAVVGGFHTSRMAKALAAAGRSYVVFTPRVTQPADEKRYRERMKESLSALQLPSED